MKKKSKVGNKAVTLSRSELFRRGMKQRKRNWQLYLMVLPALLFSLLFVYKPMYGILIAFKDYKLKLGIMASPWSGFENFERLFKSYWFPIILKNTLTLSLLSLVLGFPLPIILALMLNELSNKKFQKTIQTLSYAPHFISCVVVCEMVIMFTSPSHGIINAGLNALGMESFAFMQSNAAFKWVYVVSGIWQDVGWSSIIYFAALSGVDKQILEAAEIDGANRFQRMIHVCLPVLVPTIVVLFILNCGSLLSVGYEKVYLLQNDANIQASEVISTYVYKIGLEEADFSFSTAAGLFNSVVNCTILVLVNTFSSKVLKNSLW